MYLCAGLIFLTLISYNEIITFFMKTFYFKN